MVLRSVGAAYRDERALWGRAFDDFRVLCVRPNNEGSRAPRPVGDSGDSGDRAATYISLPTFFYLYRKPLSPLSPPSVFGRADGRLTDRSPLRHQLSVAPLLIFTASMLALGPTKFLHPSRKAMGRHFVPELGAKPGKQVRRRDKSPPVG